jgi:hypothetical protein
MILTLHAIIFPQSERFSQQISTQAGSVSQKNSIDLPLWDRPARWPQTEAEDDFVCLKYAISYSSLDCAFRTRFNTAPGCLKCEQGRFNLKRHHARLLGLKYPIRLPLD